MACDSPRILYLKQDLTRSLTAGTRVLTEFRLPTVLCRGEDVPPVACDGALVCRVLDTPEIRHVVLDPTYLVLTYEETDAAEPFFEAVHRLNVREPDDAAISDAAFAAAAEVAFSERPGLVLPPTTLGLLDGEDEPPVRSCGGPACPGCDHCEPLGGLRASYQAEQDALIVLAARASGATCDPEPAA